MTQSNRKLTLIASATLLCVLSIQGCSNFSSDDGSKINYRSDTSAKTKSLDIPPDLTQLGKETRYNIPDSGATVSAANTYQNTATQVSNTKGSDVGDVAPRQIKDVRIMRERDTRWLHVDRSADAVWPIVHEFWINNGFSLIDDQPQLGLMETDWAENRSKIPMDFIRRTLGKVLDNMYSSGERDKFRTRIERSDSGGIDIYITHRGMSEEYVDNSKSRTSWKMRPQDPELEAEFLGRLMVQLTGGTKENVQAAVTQVTTTQPSASVTTEMVDPNELTIKNTYEIAWRRVGVSLDRNGFTVEDRDRSQGIYFVRYVKSSNAEEPGFFSRMFSSSKSQNLEPQKFRIVLKSVDGTTKVTIQNSQGEQDRGEIAQNILKLLNQDLK